MFFGGRFVVLMGKNQQGKKKDGRFCQASRCKPIKGLELRAKLNPRDAVSAIEKASEDSFFCLAPSSHIHSDIVT
jgi:hypothetical protein